jgi:hypothetical protein
MFGDLAHDSNFSARATQRLGTGLDPSPDDPFVAIRSPYNE